MLDAQAAHGSRMEGEVRACRSLPVRPDDPIHGHASHDEDRGLDLDKAQALAARLVDGGSDSLIINGTTGESPTVFYPQKMELFRAVVEAVGNRVPVIANVGDNCTADTVGFARDVAELGVDGFMCVVPYYNKPPQEGMYRHFRTIADAVELRSSSCTTFRAAAW